MASSAVLTEDFKPTPYWWDLAPRPEPTEAAPPAEAETVIVGAGNVGLSAALTLARHGSDVVVLDAEAAGHGASTRNAGYLGRQVWHKYGEMVPKLGRERATEVCRAAIAAHDYASSLIEKEQIACFYRNTGRFIAAPSKRVFDGLAHDLAMMREDGVPVDAEMVEPEAAPPAYRKGTLPWRPDPARQRHDPPGPLPCRPAGAGRARRRADRRATARCRPSSATAAASASRHRAARCGRGT